MGEKLKKNGIKVNGLGLRNFLDLPRIIIQLFKIIRAYKPDIVQTWMYHSDLIGGVVARFAGCNNVIWSIRNSDISINQKGVSKSTFLIMKLCSLLSFVIPRYIICVGGKAAAVHRDYGYFEKKLRIIRNGFNLNDFRISSQKRFDTRMALSIPSDSLVIGSIARFNEYKDHFNYIKACGYLACENKNVLFLLVGRNIDYNNLKLMEWINMTGFEKRFILLGERNDIPEILSCLDIFCLHSTSEGFPNALGEAMCSSLPCVSTNVGDVINLIGEAGIVVPPNDPNALKAGILDLCRMSKNQRRDLGNKARERIEKYYTIEKISGQYKELYIQVIGNE